MDSQRGRQGFLCPKTGLYAEEENGNYLSVVGSIVFGRSVNPAYFVYPQKRGVSTIDFAFNCERKTERNDNKEEHFASNFGAMASRPPQRRGGGSDGKTLKHRIRV